MLLLINANVITMDPFLPKAGWVAVREGKIIRTGRTDPPALSGVENARIIDCKGRTVLPGFIDSHLHLLSFAESLVTLNLKPERGIRCIADIQSKIRKRAAEESAGAWIRGRGYNEFYLAEKRHPTRRDLDEAAPNHPVKLTHRSGHAHVLNSLAMERTGITMETPEPPGGMMDRDLETGRPSGLFYEMGDFLSARIPPLEDSELEKGLFMADQELLSSGITTVQDASYRNDRERYALFQSLKEQGKLHPRVHMMLGAGSFSTNGLDRFTAFSNHHLLKINGVKIILDETTGDLIPSRPELNDMVLRIHESGFQSVIHAVEEDAVDAACVAVEKALGRNPRPDHRHRIEHASVCPPYLAKRIAERGIMVVSQPGFIHEHGDRYLETVDPDQLPHLYPFRSLFEAGVRVAGSSDCPYAVLNPLTGISAAVSRKSGGGKHVTLNERIHVMDALRLYTSHGAYSSFSEREKGSISPGKLADLVVLSGDPLKTSPAEIKDLRVEMTVINGDVVWERYPIMPL